MTGLMSFILVGSSSIIVAAIIAILRYRKIHRSFRPFVFIIFVALLNEIISVLLIHVFKKSNAVTTNIFGLIEAILWMWQFRRWNAFDVRNWSYLTLIVLFCIMWSIENIGFGKIYSFSSIFSITYSFILVFLSINQVNGLIVKENRNLFTNSIFLICSGTIIFGTYRIFVESFYIFEIQLRERFLTNVFIILVSVNLFVNLLFALATLWIPTRQRFTLPLS